MRPPVCASCGEQRLRGVPLTPPPGGRALCLQSSTQEIGEELVNGLIYSISLRKVQLPPGGGKGQRWLGVSAGPQNPGTGPRPACLPGDSSRGFLPGLPCPRPLQAEQGPDSDADAPEGGPSPG